MAKIQIEPVRAKSALNLEDALEQALSTYLGVEVYRHR